MRESYKAELKGKILTLNAKIPRITKRIDIALSEIGIPFHKTRPARLLLKKIASEPENVLSEQSLEHFEVLFEVINARLSKQMTREAKPFEG